MTWPQKRLSDLGTWYGGSTPSKNESAYWTDGTVPWLSPKDMGAEVLRGTRDHITDEAVRVGRAKVVPANSVAVVVRSGILDRTVPIAFVPFETTLNQDMKALSAAPDVDGRWVAWALRSQERDILATDRKSGTTVASLDSAKLLSRTIPAPSLLEQRRIVDILEDHLSRLDAAEEDMIAAERRLLTLRDSLILKFIYECDEEATLGTISSVGTGSTPPRSNPSFFLNGTVPWLTSGDLVQGGDARPTQRVTEDAVRDARLRIFPKGTLVMAMYGEGKTRGTVAELVVDSTMNQACAGIQVLGDDVDKAWVKLVLVGSYRRMRARAWGGVQPNLNLAIVRSITIPMASREAKIRAIRQAAEVGDVTRRLSEVIVDSRTRSVALRRAVLTAAFSGKLTNHASDDDQIEELADASHNTR